ncbi:regulator of telomere elongation helicase 1, partial [Enteropsectra breve]
MVKIKINGIPLEMPYVPYPAQFATITKLLDAFVNGKSALIESPTGTGKSLSIICSVLAYNHHITRHPDSSGERPYKVFICSRTHKQIDQLIDQLRKTVYRPRISILGSKTQYCINPKTKSIDDKNSACADLLKTNGCAYFHGREKLVTKMGDKIFDIEELKVSGKKCVGCPYFASRLMAEDADVVFAPYNYLIDPKVRDASDITLKNAIVIIDEAHNIEDVCRTAGSLELSSKTIEIIVNDILGCVRKSAMLGDVKLDFVKLLDFFRKFVEASREESGTENASNKVNTKDIN